MKNWIYIGLILAGYTGWAQTFAKKYQTVTTSFDTLTNVIWMDANNDSLLDVVATYAKNDSLIVDIYQNKLDASWIRKIKLKTDFTFPSTPVALDYNHDNKIDLLISGTSRAGETRTYVYINKGNFIFEKLSNPIFNKYFNHLLLTDLNNDGLAEMVGSSGPGLYIYENSKSIFILKKDTTITITSLLSHDFDKNGINDIAFSGFNTADQPQTIIWLMKDSLSVLKKILVSNVAGVLEKGDLNHDGYFDLVIAGKESSGKLVTRFYQNNKSSFAQTDFMASLESADIKIADFTSDGLADIALTGKNSNDERINWIRTFTGDSIVLPVNKLKGQAFGDYDRDGDLDWVQLTGDSLKVFENNLGPGNKGPGKPFNAIGLQVFDRMFFYWEKPFDDHTNSNTITYDLKVYSADSTFVEAGFDNQNRNRLLVSHGNIGTANFSIQNIQGNFSFEIQSIDNAFIPQVKSICSGVCSVCATIDEQNIVACGSAPVLLTPPAPQAMWFSFSKGFLGVGDTYNLENAKTDTIFSFNPSNSPSCGSLRQFNIKTNPTDTVRISHTRYDCEGRNITMEIGSEWSNVSWKNNLNSSVATGHSLVHNLQKPIIFRAFATNDYGCQLKEEFDLKLSKPNLQLDGTQFQIIKGNSVTLSASGGQFYWWTPATTLNDNQIANPTATPDETTEYKVQAIDSLGCTVEGKVLVEVFEEAFIPTLFTPNGDGRNDNLRIYGLSHATSFRFAIYNREGNKLYETSSIQEATHSGWSGAVNGHFQPPGTYYWKVEGHMPKGDLLLNGKKAGVFLLVR